MNGTQPTISDLSLVQVAILGYMAGAGGSRDGKPVDIGPARIRDVLADMGFGYRASDDVLVIEVQDLLDKGLIRRGANRKGCVLVGRTAKFNRARLLPSHRIRNSTVASSRVISLLIQFLSRSTSTLLPHKFSFG